MKKVVVIGAGAAGMMAGITAAKAGAQVTLLEHMEIVGRKMGITGKGRCNITNDSSTEELIEHTPGNGKFLYSAYAALDSQGLIEMVNSWGLKTKTERGGRVFPESDSAIEVRNLFSKVFKNAGGTLRVKEKCKKIIVDGNHVKAVQTDKEIYPCDAVIIATGGVSYPLTGSTGDGHEMAKLLGHTVTPLLPALVPLETKEHWAKDLMGLSLKNVEVTVWSKGKKKASQFGEMMFTHFGVTGPIILSLSRTVTKLKSKKDAEVLLDINLKPALTEEVLNKRLQRDFEKYTNKQLANGMRELLPQRLIPIIIQAAGLTEDKVINQITKQDRQNLCYALQHLTVTVKGPRPLAEAIVTCGGISLKEFNPKTMESKIIDGLYAAGEVLDIDAFTGGYNLQAAFSTGYLAGLHAAGGAQDE